MRWCNTRAYPSAPLTKHRPAQRSRSAFVRVVEQGSVYVSAEYNQSYLPSSSVYSLYNDIPRPESRWPINQYQCQSRTWKGVRHHARTTTISGPKSTVESPKSKIHSQIKHWSTNLNSGRHYGLGRCPLPSPGRICKILTCGCQFIPRRQCSPVAQLGLEAIVHSNSASGICPTMITHRSTRDVKGAFFFFFFFCWWARITFPWSFGSVPGWSSQGEDSNNEQ